MGLLEGIGSIVNAGSSIVGSALQERNALRNFNLAQDMYGYQRSLQGMMFDREDNAVQRRVADLKAAGMSPILAAGQGARAGSPIPVNAPQKGQAGAQAIGRTGAVAQGAMRTMADISLVKAQKDLIDAQTQKTLGEASVAEPKARAALDQLILGNKVMRATLKERIAQVKAMSDSAIAAKQIAQFDALKVTEFSNWLQGVQGTAFTFIQANPEKIKYLMMLLQHDIQGLDLKHYEKQMILRALGGAGSMIRAVK